MRTWVRRVRLWLGVLLLAVGVIGCTVGMFVETRATWLWGPQLTEEESISRLATSLVIRHPSERSVQLGSRAGRFFISIVYAADDSTSSAGLTREPGDRDIVRDFYWNHWAYKPNLKHLRSTYLTTALNDWSSWQVAGFGFRRSGYHAITANTARPFTRRWEDVELHIPFYLPLLLGLALFYSPMRAVIVKRRRGRRGACLACGYDRRSLAADQPCPECGAGKV